MIKCFRTDIFYDPVGDLVIDMVHQPLGQSRNGDHNCDFSKDCKQSYEIYIAGTQDQVYALSHQDRSIQRGCYRHSCQYQRQDYQPLIAANVIQDPF